MTRQVIGRGLLIKRDYKIVSGGTDNHLFLIDVVSSVGSGGEEASTILENANITVNKNAIPSDTRKPWDPSGIRIGTPAITTRGMKGKEMVKIAEYIDFVLRNRENTKTIEKIRKDIKKFTSKFSIPGINI